MMQEIFKLASEHVDKSRLIGVFTKCDRLNEADAARVAARAVEDDSRLVHDTAAPAADRRGPGHGWFVVRNRTDTDTADLDTIEKQLFSQPAWAPVRADRRGTAQLRQYLGWLLSDKIRQAFPALLATLETLLCKAETQLGQYGVPRTTTHLRRVYLADLARQYELQALYALEMPQNLDDAGARVRSIVRAENEAFSEAMRVHGHLYEFHEHSVTEAEYWRRLEHKLRPLDQKKDDAAATAAANGQAATPPRARRGAHTPSSSAALSSPHGKTAHGSVRSTEELIRVIGDEVKLCSATELPGFVHPVVLRRLYCIQTHKWHDIARDHLRTVASAVGDATQRLLNAVVPAVLGHDTVHEGLCGLLGELHSAALQTALDRLQTYAVGDRSKVLQTTDPAFVRRLRLLQSLRLLDCFQRSVDAVNTRKATGASAEDLSELVVDSGHHASADNVVPEVHDALKVYYHFALEAFIRHVNNTIIEDFVLDPAGSLRGLSAEHVYALPDSEVDRLGSESRKVLDDRRQLGETIETLRLARQTARAALDRARQLGL